MRAQAEYCRIAMYQSREQRSIEVAELENDLSFTISDRVEFNTIAREGKLHVPLMQVF